MIPNGFHFLKGTYQKEDGSAVDLNLKISVEEGGIITLPLDDQEKLGYNINGFIQDQAISFKLNFAGA